MFYYALNYVPLYRVLDEDMVTMLDICHMRSGHNFDPNSILARFMLANIFVTNCKDFLSRVMTNYENFATNIMYAMVAFEKILPNNLGYSLEH